MSSSSRAAKRRRYTDIKNMLVNDLHRLTIDSGDFNNDVILANDDFVLFFKSMEDRQAVLLARAQYLEEKYREVTAIVRDGPNARVTDVPTDAVELPTAYAGNHKKFIDDSSSSLWGHGKVFKDLVKDMDVIFKKYVEVWEKKMEEMNQQADKLLEARVALGAQLHDYNQNI